MTSPVTMQITLRKLGVYDGELDGGVGPVTRAAIVRAMTSSNPIAIDRADYQRTATRLGVPSAAIAAVVAVESGGSGFSNGRPLVLPEPHRFAKLTKNLFNASHPTLSYASWDRTKYPKGQDARYDQLTRMVGLNVDAGFAAASYGKFQILGENFKACGFDTPMEFALAHATDEEAQLYAFEKFLVAQDLVRFLRSQSWAEFARRYNGPAYAANKYDQKLAAAFRAAGG